MHYLSLFRSRYHLCCQNVSFFSRNLPFLSGIIAHQWQWATDLIERLPLLSFGWGASEHELALLRRWLEQLPVDILHSRPRLCLASTQLLWTVAPSSVQEVWLDAAQATLTASLSQHQNKDGSYATLPLEVWEKQERQLQEQQDLLGEVIATRAFLRSFQENGQVALSLCQNLPSIENGTVRVLATYAQIRAFYSSSANDAQSAVQTGLQASALSQAAGNTAFEIVAMGTTALYMLGTGRLHETYKLIQQAIRLGTQPGDLCCQM